MPVYKSPNIFSNLSDDQKDLLFRETLEIQHLYFQRKSQLGLILGFITAVVAAQYIHELLAIAAGVTGYLIFGELLAKLFLTKPDYTNWPNELFEEYIERWNYFVKNNNF